MSAAGDAMRAEAGCIRTARHLAEIDRLSADAPHRVGQHVRRARFVERVLSAVVPVDASLEDWLGAWAMARMTASPGIASIAVRGGGSAAAGRDCAALLQLLDTLAVAVRPLNGIGADLDVDVHARGEDTWIHVSCIGAERAALHASDALRLAIVGGLPAAWRDEGDRAWFVVAINGVAPVAGS